MREQERARQASEPAKHKCSALSAFYEVEIFYLPKRWRRRSRNKQAAHTHTHRHIVVLSLSLSLWLAQITLSAFGCSAFYLFFWGEGQAKTQPQPEHRVDPETKRCLVSDYGRFVLSLRYIFDDVI